MFLDGIRKSNRETLVSVFASTFLGVSIRTRYPSFHQPKMSSWSDRIASKMLPNVRLKGVLSQFSTADARKKDFAYKQLRVFKNTLDDLKAHSNHIPITSIANSGAVLDIPASYFNHVRVGHLLYGLYPSSETTESIRVKPAMSLISRVVFIKEVRKGTPISCKMP